MIGKLQQYTSRNGYTDAWYLSPIVSVSGNVDDYMPDMLTVILRFVVMTLAATVEDNYKDNVIFSYIDGLGLPVATVKIIKQTINDILKFVEYGHISDIHGRYVLGADIFLNFVFILFYGLDTGVVCPIYAKWMSINEKIRLSFKSLLDSHKYDVSFANHAAAFTNKYFSSVVTYDPVTGNGGAAPKGFIQFFLSIFAWIKKIFSFIFH